MRNRYSVFVHLLILIFGVGLATRVDAQTGFAKRTEAQKVAGLSHDVVIEWNNAALNVFRANRTPPPVASRTLAILHAAIYDAVNGIDRTHETYFVPSRVPASASLESAASAAAHSVLVALFPAQASSFDDLNALILSAVPDTPQKRAGITWGEEVAQQILTWRASDGSSATIPAPSGSGPGIWLPTPPAFAAYLLPQWGFVLPFAMSNATQFRPPGPPALSSAKWAADYNEVKALGAAANSTRTPDQEQIALFWADGAGTETPSLWERIVLSASTVANEGRRIVSIRHENCPALRRSVSM
jgi:hypothetical protein